MSTTNSTGGEGHNHPEPSDPGSVKLSWKGHMAILKRLRVGIWIVILGEGHTTTKSLWEKMRQGLSKSKLGNIRKIARIAQKDSRFRYDVLVADGTQKLMVKKLGQLFPQSQVRLHRPFHIRKAAREKKKKDDAAASAEAVVNAATPRAATWCRMASMNVNGMNNKRDSLEVWMQRDQVDVLCVQEHLRMRDQWRVRLRGYTCFSADAGDKPGQRGVAVFVRNGIPAFERVCHENFVFVETLIGGVRVLVGSVYVPTKKTYHKEIFKQLSELVASERTKVQHVVLLGDFNNGREDMAKKIMKYHLGLELLDVEGDPGTWHRNPGKRMTAIDHIVASSTLRQHADKARVLREWEFSDHFPIAADFHFSSKKAVATEAKRRRIDCRKILVSKNEIRQSNRFEALRTLMAEDDIDDSKIDAVATSFVTESQTLADEVLGPEPVRRHKDFISGKAKALIFERSKQHGNVVKAEVELRRHPEDAGAENRVRNARKQYQASVVKAAEEIKLEKTKQYQAYINEATSMVDRQNFKKFFKWCKGFKNGKKSLSSRSQSMTPMRNSSGELVMDPDGILNVWASHFEALAKDSTGHSKKRDFWEARMPPAKDLDELPNLNSQVTWREVQDTMLSMSKGKAPGATGIPVEWLLLAVEDKEQEAAVTPTTPLGEVIFFLVKYMFERSYIPECFRSSMMVPIPKKGDLTLVDNYSGISLLDSVAKVVCTLVNRRLCSEIEGAGRLIKEQAGFRRGEEGIGQVISLVEICARRCDAKLPTFIGFVDFSKAYDTVPHEAVLRKLERIGVKGGILSFIRTLLDTSSFCVRMPCGLSRKVTLGRGLPQGCAISCVLFDVFINDCLDSEVFKGCFVPGVSEPIKGLLFADDEAIVSGSRQTCQKGFNMVAKWARDNEMKVNIGKCGVMSCNAGVNPFKGRAIRLGNEEVPLVKQYTYLGVSLNDSLCLKKAVLERCNKLLGALAEFRPFLHLRSVPIHIRLRVLKTFILPVATFGGELFGFNQNLVKPIQSVFDLGLKMVLLGSEKSNACAYAVLRREANIAPVHAIMSGARLRAWQKFPSLRTWAKLLGSNPVKKTAESETWFAKTGFYIKRYAKEVMALPEKQRVDAMIKMLWLQSDKRSAVEKTTTWRHYQNFSKSRDYLLFRSHNHAIIRGSVQVALMRMGAFWTGVRAAIPKYLGTQFKTKCPCCKKDTPETLSHILLRCRKWKRQRGILNDAIKAALDAEQNATFANILTGRSTEDRTTLLLGGEVDGSSLSPLWEQGDATSPDFEARTEPLFIHIAIFLDSIHGERRKYLWPLDNNSHSSQSLPSTAALSSEGSSSDPD